jgi:hypothetical protein
MQQSAPRRCCTKETLIPQRWLPWALLAATALVGIVGAPPPTVAIRLFFVAVMGGAIISSLGPAGNTWQMTAAGTLLALSLVEGVVRRPIPDPPSSQWTQTLQTPAERLRHTILLPLGTPQWERWWQQVQDGGTAGVHICAQSPVTADDGLDLYLGDTLVAHVTEAQAYGPHPEPTHTGLYRIPVTRALLERNKRAVLELRRAQGAPAKPAVICGTFTYRPSAGLDSSAFFDGQTWRSPGPTQGGRYVIEVRFENSAGKPVGVLY